MFKGKKETFFDVRVIRRNLEKGLISNEEYKEYLSKLEDASESGTLICIDELNSEDEDDIEEDDDEIEEEEEKIEETATVE